MTLTDTPDDAYVAAVRRLGGKPRPGESQVEFAARVAAEIGKAPRESSKPEQSAT